MRPFCSTVLLAVGALVTPAILRQYTSGASGEGAGGRLLGQDEGHGFAKKANQDYQFWAGLLFWQQTLLE